MGFKELIKKYEKNAIKFTSHAEIRLTQRNINKKFIVDKLLDINSLVAEENQSDNKLKLVYDHSRSYYIVIMLEICENCVKVLTAWKSSKKLDKLIKKKGSYFIVKKL